MMQPDCLAGSTALVTGGASGIGLATARLLAQLGAKVAINDLDAAKAMDAAKSIGPGHLGVAGDIADEVCVQSMVEQVVGAFGSITILVNNAGIPDSGKPTLDLGLDDWRKVIDIHATGTFLVSRAVAPHMIRGGGGAMVNLSSVAGTVGIPSRTAYSFAKAGILMLTRTLACEWAAHKIRVNAVAPGYVATPLIQGLVRDGIIDPTRILNRTPMGRLAQPHEIAAVIAFLASPLASYVTGAVLPVDGGWAAYGGSLDASAGGRVDL
jgi:NAD(P)-dependent dehydrogenase (short-subunit alcohol dehydrogenase family)